MEKVHRGQLVKDLKELVLRVCKLDGLKIKPEDIKDDDPLFGPDAPLELDSLDVTEIVVALEKQYKVRIGSMNLAKEIFQSFSTLADFVLQKIENQVREKKEVEAKNES